MGNLMAIAAARTTDFVSQFLLGRKDGYRPARSHGRPAEADAYGADLSRTRQAMSGARTEAAAGTRHPEAEPRARAARPGV